MGITININWAEPADNTIASANAAERHLQWAGGWFANPVFGNGDYPQIMIDTVFIIKIIFFMFIVKRLKKHLHKWLQIARKSAAAGLKESRLPSFTADEKTQLKGSADFFGINPYTAEYVREKIYDDTLVGFDTDQDTFAYQDKENWYA